MRRQGGGQMSVPKAKVMQDSNLVRLSKEMYRLEFELLVLVGRRDSLSGERVG
jgi:hypothetical protein